MLSLYGLLNDNFGTSSCCNLVGKNVNLGTFFQNRCALSISVLTPVTDIKKLLSTMSFLLKNYPVVESVYLSIRYNKTKFFLQIILIKMVQINKTHTHTHTHRPNTQRKIILERGWVQPWTWMLLNFCFFTVQEKQVMTSTLFWTWDLSRNRNQLLFWENIIC